MNTMKYSKVRDVKDPVRGTTTSAGIDFFVPEFTDVFLSDLKKKNPNVQIIYNIDLREEEIVIAPHERILIPSGIHVNLEDFDAITKNLGFHGVALNAHNKSGIATKKGLDRLAEVVDQDYQGEIHISIVNTGKESVSISPGEKLIQFILTPIFYSIPEYVEFENLYSQKSERGAGGFGSTDLK